MTNSVSIIQVECVKSEEIPSARIYTGEKLKPYEIAVKIVLRKDLQEKTHTCCSVEVNQVFVDLYDLCPVLQNVQL